MFPREHGAYGQLLFPLIAALAIGRPGSAALAWAAAAACAFVAHEPLLVLLGQRGRRAARDERRRAAWWLLVSAGLAVAFGAAAVAPMPAAARPAIALSAALAALTTGVVFAGFQHTAAGEVLAAVTLSSLAWPAAFAVGASGAQALTPFIVFASGFGAATLAVHAVIARTQRPPALSQRGIAVIVAAAVPIGLLTAARAALLDAVSPLAALPLAALSMGVALVAPPARQLRKVGWTLVAASAATMLALIVGI
jgi:hypothetical protein